MRGALQQLGGERAGAGARRPAAIAPASARIASGSASSARDALGVEHQHVLAGDERVEREPVGDVAGAVDDDVPEALVLGVARLRVGRVAASASARAAISARWAGVGALGAARRAASAPMHARSSSAARSSSSSGGASPWAASASSRSRPPSWRQSRTRVAPPWLMRISPDSCSRLSASRTAWRLAPSCSESRRSDGTAAPGASAPERMSARRRRVDAIGEEHWLDQLGGLVVPDRAWHPPAA